MKAARINKLISKENDPDFDQISKLAMIRKWWQTTEEECVRRNRLDLCADLNAIALSRDRS